VGYGTQGCRSTDGFQVALLQSLTQDTKGVAMLRGQLAQDLPMIELIERQRIYHTARVQDNDGQGWWYAEIFIPAARAMIPQHQPREE